VTNTVWILKVPLLALSAEALWRRRRGVRGGSGKTQDAGYKTQGKPEWESGRRGEREKGRWMTQDTGRRPQGVNTEKFQRIFSVWHFWFHVQRNCVT